MTTPASIFRRPWWFGHGAELTAEALSQAMAWLLFMRDFDEVFEREPFEGLMGVINE